MFRKIQKQIPVAKALMSVFCALIPLSVSAAEPDLTAPGVIDALRHKNQKGHYDGHIQYRSRAYDDTYNLGATGMRGWIYDYSDRAAAAAFGLATELSRKILVTTVGEGTPASGILQKDDVILGVSWGGQFIDPFTSDARRTFGIAVGEAEKTVNEGYLNIRYWRAGQAVKDVKLKLTVMDSYSTTAPYSCPKSTKILANARALLIKEMVASKHFLSPNYVFRGAGAVNGLALLAVSTKSDPDYALVQANLKSCVVGLDAPYLNIAATENQAIWRLAYQNIFLCEYYMRSVEDGAPDATALAKLGNYTVTLARAQGRFGNFGHDGSILRPDGSLHGPIAGYGSVNCAGIAANLSIVLGKKALLMGGIPLDSEIDPAIERANKFYGYYVNKGKIPYGEHTPELGAYVLNGKDEMCAIMFALQENHQTEVEFFSRISLAGYGGREVGHAGSGFNYLWEGMGANVGGPLAAAAYFKQIEWSLDLERRTDGSFTYDGERQGGQVGSTTGDGTYLGLSQYFGLNPTASHIFTYSVPLKRLYITGKKSNMPVLSSAAVDHAIKAGSFQINISSVSNEVLISTLGDYDPVKREAAADELLRRKEINPLRPAQVSSLVASIAPGTLGSTNAQIGACTALGLLKTPSALPAFVQRLSDPNLWVRAKAAIGLANLGPIAGGQVNTMLQAYAKNAALDSEVIDWADPLQISNGRLSDALFETLAKFTITSPENLLYPALRAALKQPNGRMRRYAAGFTGLLKYEDVKMLTADIVYCVTTTAPADTMFGMYPRANAINTLRKYKIFESVQAAMALLVIPRAYDWGSASFIYPAFDTLVSFGYASTPYLPALRQMAIEWPVSNTPSKILAHPKLLETIAKIERSVSYPNNDILSFVFPGLPAATISGTNITLNVPAGTNVTALAPTFAHSPSAFARIGSGTTRNFSTPQLYSIVASDLILTEKIYTVTVNFPPVTPPISNTIAFNFDDATLQGWNNRIWNGSAWVDLNPNVTTYNGVLLPPSSNNGLFTHLYGSVWVSGHIDFHLNTQWLRSPKFYLNGSGPLTIQLAKGIANAATAPANDLSVPFAAINGGGWKGVGLRRVSDGVFVLKKARTGLNGSDYRTITFSTTELASLDQNAAYTLDLINSDYGGWGWVTMDNVSIPGSLTAPVSPGATSALTGATSWSPNRVDTFAIGGDKNIYWKFWDGSVWSQYRSLNATAFAGVSATNWGVNRLDIFYSGNSSALKHKWYTGSWSGEEDLGGVIVGAPAATSWATNRIDIVCRGTDDRLYWKYFNGSWSTWLSTGAETDVFSTPAVTNWGTSRLNVFYVGRNGSLRHKWYNGSWSQVQDLGGVIVGGPSAVAWGNNRINVVVRGTDNQVYWKYWNGSIWSGFIPTGCFTFSDPSVTSRGSDTFDIFFRGANGVMKQKSYSFGSWSPEYDHSIPGSNGIAPSVALVSVEPKFSSVPKSESVVMAKSADISLPAPWLNGSIGNSNLKGSTKYTAGTVTQSGAGSIGSTSDKLNFTYQTLSGDGQITAKISALQDTGSLTGVGVMIRETLATNSKHVFLGMADSTTYIATNRNSIGAIATSASSSIGSGIVPNTWIKLVRVGDVITASKSIDGTTWIKVSSTTVGMAANCYIGLAVSSGSDTILNTSQFTNLSVSP